MLALTLALPSYVGCSPAERFRLLGPLPGEAIPINAAVWYLEFVAAPGGEERPALIDLETGAAVDAIEWTTPLRNGLLVELRPSAELTPSHAYAVVMPDRLEPIDITTDPFGADHLRPAMPRAAESESAPPLAHCLRSASILLHTETSEPGVLLLATNPSRGDLAVARDEPLVVPASDGEHLTLSVVAMDLAGNRSTPSIPIGASAGGCRTIHDSDALVLLLLPIFLLAKRRRR